MLLLRPVVVQHVEWVNVGRDVQGSSCGTVSEGHMYCYLGAIFYSHFHFTNQSISETVCRLSQFGDVLQPPNTIKIITSLLSAYHPNI